MAIRNDLKMQKGKVAAQCGHASVAAYRKTLECDPTLLKKWYQFGRKNLLFIAIGIIFFFIKQDILLFTKNRDNLKHNCCYKFIYTTVLVTKN